MWLEAYYSVSDFLQETLLSSKTYLNIWVGIIMLSMNVSVHLNSEGEEVTAVVYSNRVMDLSVGGSSILEAVCQMKRILNHSTVRMAGRNHC